MNKYLNWIESTLEHCWLRIEDSCGNDSQSLSRLRIIYGLFILIFYNFNFAWIGEIPQGLFRPKFFSLSNLFNGFPSYSIMLTIEVLLVISAFCLLLGIKARIAGIIFVIVYFVANSFHFSFGKIDHGEIVFLIFILGLSFTNWGVNNALIPDRGVAISTQKRILAILAVVLCFGMFTAGFEKALYWVDFNLETGGFLRWFYNGFFTHGRDYLLAPIVIRLPPKIFETADYFAVVFELVPFIALFLGKKWWLVWLLIASVFHLANTLLLNISFTAHAPVYLSFIALSLFSLRGKIDVITRIKSSYFLFSLTAVVGLHYLLNLLSGNSVYSPVRYATPLFENEVELELYVSIFIWTVTILLIGLAIFKNASSTKLKNNTKS